MGASSPLSSADPSGLVLDRHPERLDAHCPERTTDRRRGEGPRSRAVLSGTLAGERRLTSQHGSRRAEDPVPARSRLHRNVRRMADLAPVRRRPALLERHRRVGVRRLLEQSYSTCGYYSPAGARCSVSAACSFASSDSLRQRPTPYAVATAAATIPVTNVFRNLIGGYEDGWRRFEDEPTVAGTAIPPRRRPRDGLVCLSNRAASSFCDVSPRTDGRRRRTLSSQTNRLRVPVGSATRSGRRRAGRPLPVRAHARVFRRGRRSRHGSNSSGPG
ncbi:MAG: hypothetical protein A07HB70_00195 [uncultured archaeon A07HB70]|nr:MAG: hypothetical protein A07HB70_00195 [uncultured archaeon A07HB70]